MKTANKIAESAGLVGLLISGASHADVFDLSVGGGGWDQNLSGQFADEGSRSFDLEDDAGLDDSSNFYVWGRLEHPVPLVPNVRVEHTRLDTDGDGTVNRTFTFRGETFNVSENVNSELELNQTDVIGYYEILDNVVSLDAGLDIRFFDGDISVQSERTGETASESFSAPAPLAYAAARVDIPATGAWVRAQGSGISFNGNSFLDTRAAVGYTFDFGLGVELGYRRQDLEIDDVDGIDGDFEVDGAFAGAHYRF